MPDLTALEALDNQANDAMVRVRATLRAVQLKRNALGHKWAAITLEQSGSTTTVLIFAQTFATMRSEALRPQTMLEFDARVCRRANGTTYLTPVSIPRSG